MGGIFSKPKAPAPPPLPPPPTAPKEEPLTEERMRRRGRAGRQGTVVSSLANQITDEQASSRISKLLG